MSILENLQWRYATKRMTGEKVNLDNIEILLDSIRMTPSSIGLQPYKVLIIESPAIRQKISTVAYNQPQINECSHLLVFTVWNSLTEELSEEYLELVGKERGVSRESLSTLVGYLDNLRKLSEDEFYNWASRQAFLALGTALLTAAELRLDSTPMEGFQKEELDLLLELPNYDLRSVVLMALGFRDTQNDWLLKMKKVRRPKEDLFLYL